MIDPFLGRAGMSTNVHTYLRRAVIGSVAFLYISSCLQSSRTAAPRNEDEWKLVYGGMTNPPPNPFAKVLASAPETTAPKVPYYSHSLPLFSSLPHPFYPSWTF